MSRGGSEAASTAGVFGKMPAHGDFVRRVLPGRFVDPWDAWLSAGMLHGAEAFGESWPEAWDGAAAFRFRLSPGACGPEAVAGVLLPSGDTVGRRFPLTVAATLPEGGHPSPAWYDAAEDAATRAAGGAMDADALTGAIPPSDAAPEDPDATLDGSSRFWRGEEVLLVSPFGLPPPERLPDLLGLGAPDGPGRAAGSADAGLPDLAPSGFMAAGAVDDEAVDGDAVDGGAVEIGSADEGAGDVSPSDHGGSDPGGPAPGDSGPGRDEAVPDGAATSGGP